jgi:hypothetical protein
MRIPAALIAALALAAPALADAPNPFNDRLKALSLADRNGALRRAVTLENQRCGRLWPSLYRGMYGNLGYWQARCTPGGDYAIFIGYAGEVQVRPCADLKTLKLPVCVPMK